MSDDGFLNEETEEALRMLHYSNQQRAANETAKLRALTEKEARKDASKQPCPYCGGELPGKYEICTHCRKELAWVSSSLLNISIPAKVENRESTLRQIRLLEAERGQETAERKNRWQFIDYKNEYKKAYKKENPPSKIVELVNWLAIVAIYLILLSVIGYAFLYMYSKPLLLAHYALGVGAGQSHDISAWKLHGLMVHT